MVSRKWCRVHQHSGGHRSLKIMKIPEAGKSARSGEYFWQIRMTVTFCKYFLLYNYAKESVPVVNVLPSFLLLLSSFFFFSFFYFFVTQTLIFLEKSGSKFQFFGNGMKIEALRTLWQVGKNSGKRGWCKPRKIMLDLDGLRQWHKGISSTELIKNKRNQNVWRDMNIYTLAGHMMMVIS